MINPSFTVVALKKEFVVSETEYINDTDNEHNEQQEPVLASLVLVLNNASTNKQFAISVIPDQNLDEFLQFITSQRVSEYTAVPDIDIPVPKITSISATRQNIGNQAEPNEVLAALRKKVSKP